MKTALKETLDVLPHAAVATLAVAVAAGCSPGGATSQPNARAEKAPASASAFTGEGGRPMPAGLRAACIASVQAGASDAYHARREGSGAVRARNPVQGIVTDLDPSGVHIASTGTAFPWHVSMTLSASGCEGKLAAVMAAKPSASRNRVEYRRGDLVEWYLNGPLGLEQGFTLSRAPGCRSEGGQVTLAIALRGDLSARMSAAGDSVQLQDSSGAVRLRYSDLYVHDATGRALPAALAVQAGTLSVRFDDTGAAYPVVVDPLIGVEQTKLTASDGVQYDWFGSSVAIDVDSAIVGAFQQDDKGMDAGAAYVFVRSGGVWTEQAKLVASDGAAGDHFGASVALSGDTALVGAETSDAMGIDSGAAYVFVRSGAAWMEQAKLTAMDGVAGQGFGRVALSGDTALVGAFNDDDQGAASGSAYVFVRNAAVWNEQAKLTAGDGAPDDQFGFSVTLSGDTAVIGAIHDDDMGMNSGSAYVFVRSGGSWMQQAKLTASDGAADDEFGLSVASSADTAIIGAPRSDTPNSDGGSGYAFVRSGIAWTEQAKLIASDGATGDALGSSVAIDADRALLAAPGDDDLGSNSGSAYVFVRNASQWSEQPKLAASDGVTGGAFGSAVALLGDTIVVTALGDSPGAAYVFVLKQANGGGCTTGAECATGQCVDGVCCDAACGGGDASDCEACSVAAGAAADGTCGPVAMGRTCRPALGACDLAEVCGGSSAACPPDEVAAADTECRGAGGLCDVAETCDGSSKMCPPNVVVPAGTECRPTAGPCDAPEACDGSDLGCPADGFVAAGTECRPVVGSCDIVEVCDGNSADCPSDLQADRGTPCPGGTCVLGQCSPTPEPQEEGGCGCRVTGNPAEPGQEQGPVSPWWLALTAFIFAGRRRRR